MSHHSQSWTFGGLGNAEIFTLEGNQKSATFSTIGAQLTSSSVRFMFRAAAITDPNMEGDPHFDEDVPGSFAPRTALSEIATSVAEAIR